MCICPHAHMCEMNIKDICSFVHVRMQKGAYITLFDYVHVCAYACAYACGNVYVYAYNIWMMLVCTYKRTCV